MLEIVTKFIPEVIIENEEVKKIPKDFTTVSMQWMRSWLLKDDDIYTKQMLISYQNEKLEPN